MSVIVDANQIINLQTEIADFCGEIELLSERLKVD